MRPSTVTLSSAWFASRWISSIECLRGRLWTWSTSRPASKLKPLHSAPRGQFSNDSRKMLRLGLTSRGSRRPPSTATPSAPGSGTSGPSTARGRTPYKLNYERSRQRQVQALRGAADAEFHSATNECHSGQAVRLRISVQHAGFDLPALESLADELLAFGSVVLGVAWCAYKGSETEALPNACCLSRKSASQLFFFGTSRSRRHLLAFFLAHSNELM